VKKTFLDIVRDFILNIDKELLLSLPGFMICMLPALEDQNAELLKMVEEILKKAETIVGTVSSMERFGRLCSGPIALGSLLLSTSRRGYLKT